MRQQRMSKLLNNDLNISHITKDLVQNKSNKKYPVFFFGGLTSNSVEVNLAHNYSSRFAFVGSFNSASWATYSKHI